MFFIIYKGMYLLIKLMRKLYQILYNVGRLTYVTLLGGGLCLLTDSFFLGTLGQWGSFPFGGDTLACPEGWGVGKRASATRVPPLPQISPFFQRTELFYPKTLQHFRKKLLRPFLSRIPKQFFRISILKSHPIIHKRALCR